MDGPRGILWHLLYLLLQGGERNELVCSHWREVEGGRLADWNVTDLTEVWDAIVCCELAWSYKLHLRLVLIAFLRSLQPIVELLITRENVVSLANLLYVVISISSQQIKAF